MHIYTVAESIADAEHIPLAQAKTIAANVLADLPTPEGLRYDETDIPGLAAAKVIDKAIKIIHEARKTDPLAALADARSVTEEAQARAEETHAAYIDLIRSARSLGIPYKDIQAITGMSRGHLSKIVNESPR